MHNYLMGLKQGCFNIVIHIFRHLNFLILFIQTVFCALCITRFLSRYFFLIFLKIILQIAISFRTGNSTVRQNNHKKLDTVKGMVTVNILKIGIPHQLIRTKKTSKSLSLFYPNSKLYTIFGWFHFSNSNLNKLSVIR